MKVTAVDRFERITIDPQYMGGAPCVRGLRIPVTVVVGLLEEGLSSQEILDDYLDLEPEDLVQAVEFAAAHPGITARANGRQP